MTMIRQVTMVKDRLPHILWKSRKYWRDKANRQRPLDNGIGSRSKLVTGGRADISLGPDTAHDDIA